MATKTPMTPEEHRAKSKLAALSQGVRVWLLEDGDTHRYACPSSSQPAVAYEIIVHGRDLFDVSCNCPSGINRGSCKHIGATLLLMEAEDQFVEASETAQATTITDKLDEGPIIAQATTPVGHRDTVEDLVREGRDLERVVLATAVRLHVEDKILVSGNKTVVFD